MNTISMTLDEIGELATRVYTQNGCDEANTKALVRTVVTAERDGSLCRAASRAAITAAIAAATRTRSFRCSVPG